MAQARRRSPRQRGASQGLPGWAMLTIGLVIGLFVAFLVYLDDLDRPPNAAVESTPGAAQPDSGGGGKGSADGASNDTGQSGEDSASEKPRFEFYSILPKLEVVVPERKQGKEKGEAGTDGGDATAVQDAGGTQAGTAGGGGPFYLQAGSFQKPKQADRMKAKIALLGLDVSIQEVELDGEHWHRVRVGPYTDKAALDKARQRLRDKGIDFLVLRQKQSASAP